MGDDVVQYPICIEKATQYLFEEASRYLSPQDIQLLHQALDFAKRAHQDQMRENGDPYITHPLAVATELLSWRMDVKSLAAALLHDVVEDTQVDINLLAQTFGSEVSQLIDGLSKLARLHYPSKTVEKIENFRKMILATAKDLRIILIKLSDRLHNMRTLDGIVRQDKRQRIAEETLTIYAPIARRIGFHRLCRALEDLSFQYLFPHRYQVIKKAMYVTHSEQALVINEILTAIRQKLADQAIEAEVVEFKKNVYRIYQKMYEKKRAFFEILDIYSCQIIVRDVASCYATLGALHSLYKPISSKIKDYIAIPKNNRYQGLHTTLFGPQSLPIGVQIFTESMYTVAEFGVVANWLNCPATLNTNKISQYMHQWLQNMLTIELDYTTDPSAFFEQVKTDLSLGELYVFTPEGWVITLPRGSTAVDFAYAIDFDIGEHCAAVHINHLKKPLNTILRHGDIVAITVQNNKRPDPVWLDFVVSSQAIFAIRRYMKLLPKKEAIVLGAQLLTRSLNALSHPLILTDSLKANYVHHFAPNKIDFSAVLADVGMGYTSTTILSRQLIVLASQQKVTLDQMAIKIYGNEGGVTFAACCHPIPGDAVIGLINEHNGLIIHQLRCKYAKSTDQVKQINLTFAHHVQRTHEVVVSVLIYNELNAFAKITAAIAQALVSIEAVSTKKTVDNHLMRIHFRLRVKNTTHLDYVLARIGQASSVLNAERC